MKDPVIPIDLHFDVDKIIEVYRAVEKIIKAPSNKQVSITSLKGNDLIEGTGAIDTLAESEKEYDVLNDIFKSTYIEYMHNKLLEKFPVIRGRIMLLEGKRCYTYHRDPTWRLHIPIITSKYSILIIDDVVHRLPTLGQVYLINTTLFHTAVNMKFEDRIHIVYGLNYE